MERTPLVYMADDDPSLRLLFEHVLAEERCDVRTFSDGKALLSASEAQTPDLIFLDVRMPGMGGLEACQCVRNTPRLADIPVLFLSGLTDSKLEGIDAGADDFVSKPFEIEELQARVRTILRLNRYRKLLEEREQREQAEQRERSLTHLYANLMERSHQFMFCCDFKGQLRLGNQAWIDTFGSTSTAATQMVTSRMNASSAAQFEESVNRMARGELAEAELELTLSNRDGDAMELLASLFPVPSATSGEIEIQAIMRDATRQRQQSRARRMEAMGRLVSGVAHDLRNLISVVKLCADNILMSGDDEMDVVFEDARDLKKVACRGGAMIERLLGFGRGTNVQPVACSLSKVVGNSLDLVERSIPDHVKLVREADSDAHVNMDDTAMDQIMLNLVGNAIEAMEGAPGSIRISTSTSQVSPPADHGGARGEYACLTVTDDGPGIPEPILERIFDPFFSTKDGSGTGLGLATVYGLVQSLGGFIDVRTSPGEGTCFRLYWPRVEADSRPRRRSDKKSSTAQLAKQRWGHAAPVTIN